MQKKKILNVMLWIIGIFIILMGVTNITTSPVGGILLTIVGAAMLPPCYKSLNRKFQRYNKRTAIIISTCLSLISLYMVGSATTNETTAAIDNTAVAVYSDSIIQNNNINKNDTYIQNVNSDDKRNEIASTAESVVSESKSADVKKNETEDKSNIAPNKNLSNNVGGNTNKSYSDTTKSNRNTNSSSSVNTGNNTSVSYSSTSTKSNSASTTSTKSNSTSSASSKSRDSSSSTGTKSSSSGSSSTGSAISTSAIVYITKTGEKYHRAGCQYLRNSSTEISKSNAISQGYTACSKCNP